MKSLPKMIENYTKRISWTRNTLIGLLVILFTIPLTVLAVKHQFDIRSRAESPPDTPTLAQPTNNSTNVGVNPRFNWADSVGATSYRIYLTASDTSSWQWYTNGNSSNASWNSSSGWVKAYSGALTPPTNLANEVSYRWAVIATNSSGSSPPSAVWTFTTISVGGGASPTPTVTPTPTITPAPTSTTSVPAKPSLAAPTNNSTNVGVNPRFNWADSARATMYRIYLAPNSTTSWSWYKLVSTSNTEWANGSDWVKYSTSSANPPTNLSNNTTYKWAVIAINSAGSSPASDTWKFTTVPAGGVVTPTPTTTPTPTVAPTPAALAVFC